MKSLAKLMRSAALVVFAATPGQQAAAEPLFEYKPAWVWLGQPGTATYVIRETKWERVAQLEPERLGVLSADILEAKGRDPVLRAGTYLIGFDWRPSLWCEFERPVGRYNIGCVDDANGDGRLDSFFRAKLQHPYLFSAFKVNGSERSLGADNATVAVRPSSERTVDLLLWYANHAEWANESVFGYCVFRRDNRNIFGDKRVGNSCLGPGETIKDKGFPFTREMYGRRIEFLSRRDSVATVRVTGPDHPLRVTF